jgi:hypothetical protein
MEPFHLPIGSWERDGNVPMDMQRFNEVFQSFGVDGEPPVDIGRWLNNAKRNARGGLYTNEADFVRQDFVVGESRVMWMPWSMVCCP